MQTRRLRIEWSPGEKVTGLLAMPAAPRRAGIVLAAGAGAGQEHAFLVALRRGFAAAGYPTLTFDYAYRERGRRAPDRLPRLLEVHHAAAERLATYVDSVVLAGKSMGGRVGSHLAGDAAWPAAGLVYFGYPLVPLGSKPPRPTHHLGRIDAPQLFWAGTRDRLSPPSLLEPLARSLPGAQLNVVAEADHGFEVPKRSGRTHSDVVVELVEGTVAWMGAAVPQATAGGR